jgi:PAS domain S-box-containing protein
MADLGLWQRLGRAWSAWRGPVQCCTPGCDGGGDRLARLLSAAPAAVYAARWHDDFPLVFVSDNVSRLVGLPAQHLLAHPQAWSEVLHPDDRERRRAALADLAESGQTAIEYRYRPKDGSAWLWLRDEARLVRDPAGQPIEVVGSWLDITQRHKSEEALAASELQLRVTQRLLTDALESSDDAFSLFDAKDRLLLFNSRYREIYATISDLIRPGVSFEQLIRASAKRGQYAGIDAEHLEEWVADRVKRHRTASGVFEQQLADGRCLEIVERPTSGGGRVGVRRDVTARKRIEEALRQELAFKQTLIDALPFPVFFKGVDGRYLGCNSNFAKVLGRTPAEIVGAALSDLMPADKAEEYMRSDRELLLHPGVQSYETNMQWADGKHRRLNVFKGTFNDADGNVAGIIGSLIDITPQKRAEEQLVQAAKLATLGQIASEVAHELNQPLSIIRMSAESCLQARGEIAPDQVEHKLSIIVGQVRRMAEIVDHLRSFSRFEGGEKRAFAPAPVIAATVKLLAPQFQLDGIGLEVQIDEGCPDICGHPNQLEQVALNLLSNARDAVRARVPPGKGNVRVGLCADGDMVRLTVHDNGGGIPDSLWPMVFDPFFTTKAEGTGTGLGLSISAHIVAGMDGRIDGRNDSGGARFEVSLPAHRSAVAADAAPPPPQAPANAKARGERILVVDDEELAVECIAEVLGRRGYEVTAAFSPAQALERAQSGPLDLVISDIRMPGMEGATLLARLRRCNRDLPAILMTGGPLPTEPPAPRTTVLSKPLALDELIRATEQLLSEGRSSCDA